MHLPWGWIKQRPHFLAEHLDRHFDVQVFVRQTFERSVLVNNCLPSGMKLTVIPMLRLTSYLAFMDRLNNRLINMRLRQTLCHFDIIWLTHPDMYELVRWALPEQVKVVYDCMDNYPAFPAEQARPHRVQLLYERERALLERSDQVYVSSEALMATVRQRHQFLKPMTVVNNGVFLEEKIEGTALPVEFVEQMGKARFRLTYIGTIASWLDLDLIQDTVKLFPQIVVFLVGPAEVKIPCHERIVHLGPIDHKFVPAVMAFSDALFMPFVLSELVRDVDPVKLYEYVYSGKPALAIGYPETIKFGDFVYLYNERKQFLMQLEEIVSGRKGAKQPSAKCRQFGKENTWAQRAAFVAGLLN